jgi:hypothetical protein
MITVLAFLAVAPPSSPPGVGTRLSTEVGVTRYDASFEAERGGDVRKVGVDGYGARVRSILGFAVVPGFALGPTIGLDYAWLKTTFKAATGVRVGIEAAYYPDPKVGFHINGGFGLLLAGLASDASATAVAPAGGIGSYWTIGLARDWAVGPRSRIGAIIRLEADSVAGRDENRIFHFRALTPSLSVVLVSGM